MNSAALRIYKNLINGARHSQPTTASSQRVVWLITQTNLWTSEVGRIVYLASGLNPSLEALIFNLLIRLMAQTGKFMHFFSLVFAQIHLSFLARLPNSYFSDLDLRRSLVSESLNIPERAQVVNFKSLRVQLRHQHFAFVILSQ